LEQILLYLAVLAALAGFGMGLLNLAGPLLKRRNIALPSPSIAKLLRRGQTDDDDDFDLVDEDDLDAARDFAGASFAAGDSSLLAPRTMPATGYEDEELDEELAQVLEKVAEEELEPPEDEDGVFEDETEADDDGPFIYTVSAEAADESEGEEGDGEEGPSGEDQEDDDLEDSEDGDDEEDEDESQPEVQVVAAAGEGDDMLSFFSESADAGAKEAAAWRHDLPDVSIEDLLAEARAISEQIQGKKHNAA
jgi:hypothetical protein